jgi:hypothetical protein
LRKAKQSARRRELAANLAVRGEPLWNLSGTIFPAMPFAEMELAEGARGETPLLESNLQEERLDRHGRGC